MEKYFKNKNRNVNRENCIPCALYPLFRFGILTQILSITSTCEHQNGSHPNFYFYVSIGLLISEWVVLFFLVLALPFYIDTILKASNQNVALQYIATAIFCLNSLEILIADLFKKKLRTSGLNTWTRTVKNSSKYHIKVLLSNEKVKNIRRSGFLYNFVIILIISNLTYWEILAHNFETKSEMIIISANVLATFVQVALAFQFIAEAALFKTILLSWQDVLKELLNNRLTINNCDKEISLDIRLGKINRVYKALIYELKMAEKYLNPSALYWLISILLILVINIYILLVLWGDDVDHVTNILLHVRTFGIVAIILYFAVHVFRLENVSEDILSFLFKYPISNLSPAETVQVETLITTLIIQKPVLRASDIFTIGTRLLASITGTVVTYVLVALQFHAFWTK